MKKWYSLFDKIYRKENLIEAFKRVKRNHGAPGIDGETVEKFAENLEENIKFLHEALKTKTYEPSPVRRIKLEKPDGGIRKLGISTVRDRVVQQAVVNMDLSKCFDTLDHGLIMQAISERISDGSVLKLINSFLESGVMHGDTLESTEEGSPQGGVISPLISNIYLNKFDQKMMEKGIRIVRYADDILIFAHNKQEVGNHMACAAKVLEKDLKLTINRGKTKLTSVCEGVDFLGFVIWEKHLTVRPKRIKRFKDKVRQITKRNTGRKIEDVIKELNGTLRGWINYYRIANIRKLTGDLMQWIRRRLRMLRMKQWKSYKKMHKELRRQGIAHTGVNMDVCRWKNSATHIIHQLMPNAYFNKLNLINLETYEVGLLSNYY